MNTIDHARSALLRNDLATARALTNDILRQQPNDPNAWLLLSEVALSDYERIDALNRVLALDPANPIARQRLAGFAAPPAYAPYGFSPPNARMVQQSRVSLAMKILIGVLIGLIAFVAIAALIAYFGGAFEVKTPAVPAEQRATEFSQAILSASLDQRFYDPATIEALVGPIAEEYILPLGRAGFMRGMQQELRNNPSIAGTKESVSLIESMTIVDPTYAVDTQSATTTVLRVSGGDVHVVTKSGEFDLPLDRSFKSIVLTNQDGVWYVSNVEYPK